MSHPIGLGQPGSWTRRRFIIDLTFAGGAIVAAAWLAYGNQSSVESTIKRATATPTAAPFFHQEKPLTSSVPVKVEEPKLRRKQHGEMGGAPAFQNPSKFQTRACGPSPQPGRSSKPNGLD